MITERRTLRLFSSIEIALRDIQRVESKLENGQQGTDLVRSAISAINLGHRDNALRKLKHFQLISNVSPESRALIESAMDELRSKSATAQFFWLNGSSWYRRIIHELWDWRFKIAVWLWIKLGLPLISHRRLPRCKKFVAKALYTKSADYPLISSTNWL